MAGFADEGQQEIEEGRVQVAHRWARDCLAWVRREEPSPAWRGWGPDWAFDCLHSSLSPISNALDKGRPPPSRSPSWPALQSSLSQLLPALSSTPPAGVESGTIEKVKVEIKKFLEKSKPSYEDFTVLMQKNDELTRSIKEKEESIEKLTDENIHVKKQKEKTDIKLEELKRRSDKERNESSKLTENMKNELQAKVRELESVTEEKDALEKDVDKMKQQEASLAGLLEKRDEERNESSKVIENLKSQLEVQEKEIQSLREEKKDCDRDMESMKQQEASLQKERQRLKLQLQHVQKRNEEEKKALASTLEREMQVAEEIRQQLQRAAEERKVMMDYQKLMKEAVERVEHRQEEAAAHTEDTEHRLKSEAVAEFMARLPHDVKKKCLYIQQLVGGMGRKFEEALLNRHVTWTLEELQDGGLFFTCTRFWRCIEKWVQASSAPHTDVPLTLQHLEAACSQLSVDPASLTEMPDELEKVLEKNFTFLAKNVLFVQVAAYLRDSGRLTEEARTFLLLPGTRHQKTDRLLAVVYSLGQDGFSLLMDALESSDHPHVVDKLQKDLPVSSSMTRGEQSVNVPSREMEGEQEEEDEKDVMEDTAVIKEVEVWMQGLSDKMEEGKEMLDRLKGKP